MLHRVIGRGVNVVSAPKNRPVTYGVAALITLCSPVYVWMPTSRGTLALIPLETGQRGWLVLLTNGFISLGSSPLNCLLLVGLMGYFNQSMVRGLWRRFRWRLVTAGVIVTFVIHLLQSYLFAGMGWGYLSAMLVALWLGFTLEVRWGSRRLLMFSMLVGFIAQVVGMMLASMFSPQHTAMGAHPLFNGWMTALCLMNGRHLIPGMNIKSIHLVWLLILLDGLALVLDSSLGGAMGLVGTGTAWLVVSGRWRPERLIPSLRAAMNERRQRKRRERFRIIPGKKN